MTDKQIITKDVDARGCKFFRNGVCASPINPKCKLCVEISEKMCYYKQLVHKEQECEELKKELMNKDEINTFFNTPIEGWSNDPCEIYQHKAENDKYSLFIEKLCDYAGLECDDEEQAMRTLYDLASQMNKARWIIDRYKQTLTEIKEIAEKQCVCGVNCIDMKQILQKISESGVK